MKRHFLKYVSAALVVCMMLGMLPAVSAASDPAAYYTRAISALSSQGLLGEVSDISDPIPTSELSALIGTEIPALGETVTFGDAIRALLMKLGYAEDAMGTKYIKTAKDIGLLDNVSGTVSRPLTYGQAAALAVNAIRIMLVPPTATMEAGTYVGSVTVELDCAAENALIFYTTDNTPAREGKPYTGPITIDKTANLRAVAYLGGFWSAELQVKYDITREPNPYEIRDQLLPHVIGIIAASQQKPEAAPDIPETDDDTSSKYTVPVKEDLPLLSAGKDSNGTAIITCDIYTDEEKSGYSISFEQNPLADASAPAEIPNNYIAELSKEIGEFITLNLGNTPETFDAEKEFHGSRHCHSDILCKKQYQSTFRILCPQCDENTSCGAH